MLLLVGLGNPGARYVDTRHNVGFRVVEVIARRHGFVPWRQRFQGLACTGTIAGEQISLLLPGTFMNESGRAVAEAVKLLKLSHNEVTVFHVLHPDELDFPFNGMIKFDGMEALKDQNNKGTAAKLMAAGYSIPETDRTRSPNCWTSSAGRD